MADYYPLIARAVAGLERNTGEARRALYERARAALVNQLRGVDPPLDENDVTRERLALEEAIRKVEAEAARRARLESVPGASAAPPPLFSPPRPAAPPAAPPVAPQQMPSAGAVQTPPIPPPAPAPRFQQPRPAPRPPVAPPPAAPEPVLRAPAAPPPPVAPRPPRSADALSGQRPDLHPDLHAGLGAEPPPPVRDPFAEGAGAHDFDRIDTGHEPLIGRDALQPPADQPYDLAPPAVPAEAEAARPRRRLGRAVATEEPTVRPRRSYLGMIKLVVGFVLFAGLIMFGYWQRGTIVGLYQAFRGTPAPVARQAPAPQPQTGAQPKISDRIGQPSTAPGPAVAQRVVLYEEEPSDPQGKRYVGSAIWRTETVSPGAGQPPELAVRADVEIPERRITMKFSLRRNTDQTLPASHTIEIMFNLPADFEGGGISNVPGILMKQSEQTRGVPLSGLAVKVMTGFFLIGLSATDTDIQRNIQLLKERAWFDIPVVYNNNRRAILALEKGTPGERAFAEAFATWKQ